MPRPQINEVRDRLHVIGADPVRAMRCVLDVHGGLAVNDPKESTRFCEQSSGTGKAREAYRSTFLLLLLRSL